MAVPRFRRHWSLDRWDRRETLFEGQRRTKISRRVAAIIGRDSKVAKTEGAGKGSSGRTIMRRVSYKSKRSNSLTVWSRLPLRRLRRRHKIRLPRVPAPDYAKKRCLHSLMRLYRDSAFRNADWFLCYVFTEESERCFVD